MRIGVDVGGTNTDAVLMDGGRVLAWTKQPTSADVEGGVTAAIRAVLEDSGTSAAHVSSVMIGTTHFVNALVERRELDRVGVLRLASPSGEALPPLTGWPEDLAACIGRHYHLLPGGYEVDGREMAPLDEVRLRDAALDLKARGIAAIAVSCAFSPINAAMEQRVAALLREVWPEAAITLSSEIGRIGFIERENSAILNAALTSLAARVVRSFGRAVAALGIEAPLFISQNDGTLVSAAQAEAYPVMTMGSGPTNSMRGAAFLSGVADAIVMDVGGTTTDIGVLASGYPRESSISVDIGGARTNFRMPDILAIGLGGGTRIHLDPALYEAGEPAGAALRVGPDSVGYRLAQEGMLFGGQTLTASDIALRTGQADFGDPALLPAMSDAVVAAVDGRIRAILEEGLDRMKTGRDKVTILAVGGGNFLIPDSLGGAAQVIRPPHAVVANAVGAAIAQVGAQVERVVSYDALAREEAIEQVAALAREQVLAAGGDPASLTLADVEETYLSYLPGRAVQIRVRAVADLAFEAPAGGEAAAIGVPHEA
ncbi:hydantoinase/oxoprolinase family protein [Novosphingobium sp. ST904]|uniref:hydantoinase/oxoprolinase N-terminal domain-containing protein n=1 Tax=Novosphingobium sp. ST904 TaxID=1684385 RepID=UPI0006C877D6|nr:hydantoinase/oxoprolinase family protein [Novosphingobium sp. ST904]KPH65920.1 hydantoinase subunit beta [Novosphingobium sp. ST904]TCM38807.1 N-methylhydantoinase A/oxoprolinase/acetone carboxylase beta subunit [Novosphingobium sp. ST904]